MKKIFYVFAVVLFISSCNSSQSDDYQVALESEGRLTKLQEQLKSENLSVEEKERLGDEYDNQFEEVKSRYAYLFEKHINEDKAQEIFTTSKWTRRFSEDQLATILKNTNSSSRTTDWYKTYIERLNNMKISIPGYPYKNTISIDTLGQQIALSDFVGNGKSGEIYS